MHAFTIFFDFLKKLYRSRSMIRMMALRDLRAQYMGSLLGFVWSVVNPLAQLAIYGIVFGVFFKAMPDPVYKTDSFLLFLLCGLVPWQFFAQIVGSSTNVLVANSSLIKKAVGFNSEILPVITVLSNIISHLIGIVLLLLIAAVMNGRLAPVTPVILVYLFFIMIFSVGIGWMLSSVNVYLRDVQQVVGVVMLGWMFFTPIFYSPGVIPERFIPLMKLNPLYHLVEGYRLALLAGEVLPLQDLAYLAVVSLITLAAGGMLFRRLKPGFAEAL